jgi:predicted phage terminase large subunit-like protein
MASDFRSFIDEFTTEAPPAKHHEVLIKRLQMVADGKIPRLMVFMPPGAAKSYYANVMFSAWWMTRNHGGKLITSSYSQEVADKWGRRVRSIVRDERYKEAFGVSLSQESQAAGRWALNDGTEYYAVGVGGSITSFRADGAILDDPVKGREEAESETVRNKVKEWYNSDFWTRLKPGAFVVLIMTRWHEDDLGGWQLEMQKQGGEKWDVLSLPMICESNDDAMGREIGQPLWPEWFTTEMLTQAKRDVRNWSSLYQQRPSPETGAYFDLKWFKNYDTLPDNLRIYGASDYAVTDGGGDYTVHGVFGLDTQDNIYVIDWWRGQKSSLDWVEQLILMIKAHNPVTWFEEGGVIFKSLDPLISKRQRETQAYCTRKQITRTKSKEMSAQAIRGRMQQGKVLFPHNSPWVTDLKSEMLSFPAGKYDDQVDVMALIGLAIGEMSNIGTQYKSIMMG